MSDLKRFNELVDDIWEMVFGTKRRPETNLVEKSATTKSRKKVQGWIEEQKKKPKRARGKKGKYLADDKSTKDVNEAWVGGKAPKKRKKNVKKNKK